MHLLQRKYIDLIYQVSSKWVNWDPPIPIEVGAYGIVERDTGDFIVQGNIYHKEFQKDLHDHGLQFNMDDHKPQEGGAEQELIYSSRGATRVSMSLGPQVGFAGLATASISGQWQFEQGRRDALLIMHCPRIRFIPPNAILEKLYDVPKLRGKWLVTNVYVCPAFSMYLSNKSGERVSLALTGQVPLPAALGVSAGAEGSLGWWSDTQADLLRKACDKAGNYCYTPLYSLKRRNPWYENFKSVLRAFRDGEEDPSKMPTEDDLWEDSKPEWQPLDDDGEEDAIDFQEREPEDTNEF
ncbi:hypothetical protein V8E55_010399 [Tylopilus felleus]|jgi:hypothetical protein